MKKRWLKRGTAFILMFLIAVGVFGGAFSDTVHGKDRRIVKVAFFPMSGYNEKTADGRYTGMDVEYLDELCRYVNWQIEYVECESWDEALQLLKDQEVDLVGSAQYSAERAGVYQYADLSSGYTFGIIATNPDSMLAYEDFEAMKGITFGVVKTYVRKNEFLSYLENNGIFAPRIREYNSASELQEALRKGEVDAMVHSFTEIHEGQRMVGRFAPRPFYYISYRGNDDVMRELNHAIADLKMNSPELEAKLMNKFYQSRLDKSIVFSMSEKQYIADTEYVTVGYFDGYYPFLYQEGGECKGLTKDLLEGIAAVSGLTLKWHEFENPEVAHAALKDGVIDVLSYCTHTDKELGEYDLVKLQDYAQIPMVLVMKKNVEMASIETLALVEYLRSEAENVADITTTSLLVCDTQQKSVEAVKNGEADAALCDGHLAEYMLSAEPKFYDMEIRSVLSGQHGLAIAVRSDDAQLAGILNKTLLTIDARAISDYMLERNTYSIGSMGQFLQDHSVTIIVVLVFLMATIILIAAFMIRDTLKIRKLMYKDVDIDIGNLNHLIYRGMKLMHSDQTKDYFALRGKKNPQSNQAKKHYVIAYINIAQFQNYKLVYGWAGGQKLMAAIASVLPQCIDGEKGEICAKADSDHFVLLVLDDDGGVVERMRNIKQLIEDHVFGDIGNQIEIQIGVYYIPAGSNDFRGAVICANQAIDFIRESKDGGIKVYDDAMEKAIKERHEKEAMLDSVDIEENFVAYYQAKVDVVTEKVVGAEALVRFMDTSSSGKVISPGFFIPYYEQTGKVMEIDFFVLKCVCRMLRKRLDNGEPVVTISCNFSRIHFTKPDFAARFEETLAEYGIPKELVEVEITETLVMEGMEVKMAEQTMVDLYTKGIRLSIDDFGSGYSSLGVIEKIPASVIKLDRSFLLNQEDRNRQVKIMKSIVDLARSLGAQIVCEGVETEADVELMREIGARIAQGYRYAKPVPEAEFEQRLGKSA